MANEKTAGDELFEEYLATSGSSIWKYEPKLGTRKTPDFLIHGEKTDCVCEVKSFENPSNHGSLPRKVPSRRSAKSVFGPTRNKLRDAARQLKELEGTGRALVVVLAFPSDYGRGLRAQEMAWAMQGDPTWFGSVADESGAWFDEPTLQAGRNGSLRRSHPYISGVVCVYRRPIAADFLVELAETNPELSQSDRYAELADALRGGAISLDETRPAADVFLAYGETSVAMPDDAFRGSADRRYELDDMGNVSLQFGPPAFV